MAPIRVGLLARDPLRILGIQQILSDKGPDQRYEVVPLETPTAHLLAGLDVLLLDAAPAGEAFAVMALCLRLRPQTRLLVIGHEADPAFVEQLIEEGARGYLQHQSGAEDLRAAVRVVGEGSIWAPRRVLTLLLERARQSDRGSSPRQVTFTPREAQVLQLLVLGNSNVGIGQALGTSEGTIKAHLSRMMARSGTANRTELTIAALREGWLQKSQNGKK